MTETNSNGLLMLDIAGTRLTGEDRDLLIRPQVGGLILFSRNFHNRTQLCELIAEIRHCRHDLLIAVDQEGGRVQRFREGFTRLPAMASLSSRWRDDPESACQASRLLGRLMAAELTDCGLDISFAPVLDLDYGNSEVIGDRSFGASPEQVVALAGAFIEGMRASGMSATGKHFPGHGYVAADSHLELPRDDRSLVDIEATDLQPFIQLAGQLDGIMPAHVIYPQVDPDPAGFSPYWLRKVLRDRLLFRGCIFSDDLAMAGARVAGGYPERAAAALNAGCDMVLVCNDRDGALQVLRHLEQVNYPVQCPAASLRAAATAAMDSESLDRARVLAEQLCTESNGAGA